MVTGTLSLFPSQEQSCVFPTYFRTFRTLAIQSPREQSTVTTLSSSSTTSLFCPMALQIFFQRKQTNKQKEKKRWQLLGLGRRRNTFWKAAKGLALVSEALPSVHCAVQGLSLQRGGIHREVTRRALEMDLLSSLTYRHGHLSTKGRTPWKAPQVSSPLYCPSPQPPAPKCQNSTGQ